ncbi:MAG: mercury transporter [Acidobacteria bacterium]|nr:mercury transporter [Acidobacteriota bacterium]MCA1650493.1 mercury transporter [Acidobacteriota bacterium]
MEASTQRRLSEAGAITSAATVAATIFCCLPFASGVVGAGIAAFGAQFAPFRPYFSGLSLALLAYAFYQTYRRATRCDDGHCETPPRRRRRRFALFGIATLVLLLLTSSLWADWIIYWTL